MPHMIKLKKKHAIYFKNPYLLDAPITKINKPLNLNCDIFILPECNDHKHRYTCSMKKSNHSFHHPRRSPPRWVNLEQVKIAINRNSRGCKWKN